MLDERELQVIAYTHNYDRVARFLKEKDAFNFNVGDYLIKQHSRGGNWITESISSENHIPKRYMCIHQDEYGIKYVRAISVKGEKLHTIHALTEINNGERYVLDPDYADHLILGDGEYSFTSKNKNLQKQKERIDKLNKKMFKSFDKSSHSELMAFFEKMQPNDVFYYVWGKIIPKRVNECTFIRMSIDGKGHAILTVKNLHNTRAVSVDSFLGYKLSTQKPIQYDQT